MIEKQIKEYLSEVLGVPCFLEMPDNLPAEFLTIQKTGSASASELYSPNFVIAAYSSSMFKASALNEMVKQAMKEAKHRTTYISTARLNNDYYQPDNRIKAYCYRSVWVLTLYE